MVPVPATIVAAGERALGQRVVDRRARTSARRWVRRCRSRCRSRPRTGSRRSTPSSIPIRGSPSTSSRSTLTVCAVAVAPQRVRRAGCRPGRRRRPSRRRRPRLDRRRRRRRAARRPARARPSAGRARQRRSPTVGRLDVVAELGQRHARSRCPGRRPSAAAPSAWLVLVGLARQVDRVVRVRPPRRGRARPPSPRRGRSGSSGWVTKTVVMPQLPVGRSRPGARRTWIDLLAVGLDRARRWWSPGCRRRTAPAPAAPPTTARPATARPSGRRGCAASCRQASQTGKSGTSGAATRVAGARRPDGPAGRRPGAPGGSYGDAGAAVAGRQGRWCRRARRARAASPRPAADGDVAVHLAAALRPSQATQSIASTVTTTGGTSQNRISTRTQGRRARGAADVRARRPTPRCRR